MKHRTIAAICLILSLPVVSQRQGFSQETSPEGTASVTVNVEAAHPWVDSGVTVRKGERLTFAAEGSIQWGTKSDQVAGPDGHDGKAGKLGVGGLIGRVGYNGKPFPIGSTRTPVTMSKSGKLFLGINDFIFGDNAGSFTVTISQPKIP